MKNKLTLTFATAIILFAGLGCGVIDKVQKLTNTFIARIDELTKNKEQEIMSV